MEYSPLVRYPDGYRHGVLWPDLHHFPHHGNGCESSRARRKTPAVAAAAPAAAPAPAPKPQGMQPEILAAITAALSEEIGIPSRSMNIVNIKKI